jgi:hypothetical protein
MHPEISRFPSILFYDSKLIDAPKMLQSQSREWHRHPQFRPYLFYNVHQGTESRHKGKSFYNEQEGEVAVELVAKLCGLYPDINVLITLSFVSYRLTKTPISSFQRLVLSHRTSSNYECCKECLLLGLDRQYWTL